MDLRIININDIEELILAKYSIDKYLIENNIIESKTELNDFITNYAMTDYVYMINDKLIPFKLLSYDVNYLFITSDDKDDLKLLLEKLKSMKFDMNNKVEITTSDILKDIDSYDSLIIYNKKYYK